MTERQTPRIRGWDQLRLSVVGCWVGLVFAGLSFLPSLIPRPALYQGALAGVSGAIGYGLGVLAALLWRELADREPRPATHGQVRLLSLVTPTVLVLVVVAGGVWQRNASVLVGMEPENPVLGLLVIPVGVLLFLLIIGIARALRAVTRVLIRGLNHLVGPRAARVIGVAAILGVVALVFKGVLFERVSAGVNSAFSLTNGGTPEGLEPPTSPLRSGSPGSLVEWESLGFQGRGFVGQGPGAAQIAEVAQASGAEFTTALDPIRAYAGLDSAPDVESRARLAVQDLERAGGFDRSNLLVVTTTGTGWVEPTSVTAVEYLTGGDVATVSMQYSFLPSPMSFLADRDNARGAGRALFDAVYERWQHMPADSRPALWAFGESLGSYGAEAAFSGEFDMGNRLSGAVFTGPPNFNFHFRDFLDQREAGSTEIEPVFREGRIVRFTLDSRRITEPVDQPWDGARVLYMVHPSDAITWWSPDLLLQRPDWLIEPRGADVSERTTWIPFVTFWQLSADLGLAMEPGPGHGHNFAGEHVDAWAQVLRIPGWSSERANVVREAVLTRSRDPFAPTG